MTNRKPNVAWIPCNQNFSKNRLFEITASRDNALERFVIAKQLLASNGIDINTIDLYDPREIDVVIFEGISVELRWLVQVLSKNPSIRIVNIPLEPLVVSPLHDEVILPLMPFDRFLVWNDNLAQKGLPFVKKNYGEPIISGESIPASPFENRKFLAAIYSNKVVMHEKGLYEERLKAFDFLSRKPESMDLYGMGWGNSTLPFVSTTYKGICKTKKDILKNYKFSLCFENTKDSPGYITEKIFDCFAAGTVPIYYGAPNVQDHIPKACFIDFRDFSGYEELYQFLINMTADKHQTYLDAVRHFIESKEYYEFTSKRFAEIVLKEVQSLMKSPKPYRTVLGFKWSLLKIVLKHPVFFLINLKRCKRFLFDLVFSF